MQELYEERKAADVWLLTAIGHDFSSGGFHGLKDEGTHHPQAIRSEKLKEVVCKSLNTDNIFVNVPLVNVLAGMPNYGRFLKDLMAEKGEHEQTSSSFLEAECAAIVKKSDMPPKLGDTRPFIVPCRVNESELFRFLADSGASINLMPYSIYSRLGLGELKPTNTGVRLIDQSVNKSIGIAENLDVKVGELEFPTDFVVVDMIQDKVVPIILDRPFLATAGNDAHSCTSVVQHL
ncbi:uncharacterized protein [Rutidosis leptorrhynchoides]|uniref:uncharacterized protein n=1 Tax=Rutidosis leptorrhynchoides TaxID=125765 RepID=UPI003A99268B